MDFHNQYDYLLNIGALPIESISEILPHCDTAEWSTIEEEEEETTNRFPPSLIPEVSINR